MPAHDSVPDPTDWIGTPLASISSLETALQCHVCKELFNTAMITSCSHTFCSLCIRRCLSHDGRCPACRSTDQESKLRRNWAMEECVSVFRSQRQDLLALARRIATEGTKTDAEDGQERPRKRRRIKANGNVAGAEEVPLPLRATRSQSRIASQAEKPSQEPSAIPDSEDDADSLYSDENGSSTTHSPPPAPSDGLVACPMCSARMKMEAVYTHLDSCTGKPPSPPPQPSKPPIPIPSSIAYTAPQPSATSRPRLPALSYTLLSEPALRRKLAEIGIPFTGNKPLMQRRHTEWMNLWNASCDAQEPRPKKALLRDLDAWERTQGHGQGQGRQIGTPLGPSSVSGGVMSKEFDKEGWRVERKGEFEELIARARMGRVGVKKNEEGGQGEGAERAMENGHAPKDPVTNGIHVQEDVSKGTSPPATSGNEGGIEAEQKQTQVIDLSGS